MTTLVTAKGLEEVGRQVWDGSHPHQVVIIIIIIIMIIMIIIIMIIIIIIIMIIMMIIIMIIIIIIITIIFREGCAGQRTDVQQRMWSRLGSTFLASKALCTATCIQ